MARPRGITKNKLSPKQLIDYMAQVRAFAGGIPVTTTEPWNIWKDYPDLAKNSDLVIAHIHPYWDKMPIENAAIHVSAKYQELQSKFPGKQIIIGETGWPSGGQKNELAVPNRKNQEAFMRQFIQEAETMAIPYFLFEAFDER